MSRPTKAVVEYFPHYVVHGKTMFTLESKFQNDGYAFWFKLLELLGAAEHHYIDCNNNETWEFLLAKTHVSEHTATEILVLLSRLGAIDNNLWANKIIRSENFIKNLSSVYKRRGINVYTNQDVMSYCIQKPRSHGINDNICPQSKVKESKVKESITHSTSMPETEFEEPQSCESLRVKMAQTDQVAKPVAHSTTLAAKRFEITENQIQQLDESLTVLKTAGMAVGNETHDQPSTTLAAKRFDEFWEAYPRKIGKKAAELAWGKLKLNAKLHSKILAAIAAAKKTEQWAKEGGRFIPNPTTWLNQGRWDDEYTEIGGNGIAKHSGKYEQNGTKPRLTGFKGPESAWWYQKDD